MNDINSVLQTLARNRDRGTARKGHVMFDTSQLTERRSSADRAPMVRWYRNETCHGISPSLERSSAAPCGSRIEFSARIRPTRA